jgi:hypothetical protein
MKTIPFKNQFSLIVLLIILFSLSGCYAMQTTSSRSEILNTLQYDMANKAYSWKGDTKQALIRSWGPPTKTSSDGSNGEILTYINTMQFSFGYYIGNNHFYIDKTGKIYHVVYQL